ncbi:hypothetical protein MTsPCn5_19150 [Croceitalea sp. MTPC5]|uniref:hypothetical protein n=1 Tax=Croceitalea sp. MTPC5 TaxID=3056565 RepID=UPI002B3FC099|nr:hypothetical protein MTsPCn5_19150 [Croceitalea sp. MTPC5]
MKLQALKSFSLELLVIKLFLFSFFMSTSLSGQDQPNGYYQLINKVVLEDRTLDEYMSELITRKMKTGEISFEDSVTVVNKISNRPLRVHNQTVNAYMRAVLERKHHKRINLSMALAPYSIEAIIKRVPYSESLLDSTQLDDRIRLIKNKGRFERGHYFSFPVELDKAAKKYLVYHTVNSGYRKYLVEFLMYTIRNGEVATLEKYIVNHH